MIAQVYAGLGLVFLLGFAAGSMLAFFLSLRNLASIKRAEF